MNQYGKIKKVDYHGYLFGLLCALKFRKDNNFHSIILVTGEVGAGKSSMVEGLAALDAHLNGQVLDFDNISWRTEPFLDKMNQSDNIAAPLLFDESVMGITGKSIGNTSIGFKLKVGFITRRFKKHTYYLLVDEICEYSEKFIKMCDAWIHVKAIGVKRGYFNCYTSKGKINFLFNAFKKYKKNWNSQLVRGVAPDGKGTYMDYSGKFFNNAEYKKRKDEETKQLEEGEGKTGNISWSPQKAKGFYLWSKGNMTQQEIAHEVGVKRTTVSSWVQGDFQPLTL